MVHVRLNERETNPNAHVNFITPLNVGDAAAEEDARQLLRALAAQVKPLMKAHGFTVNSLEEYEYNKVFAGRNWNAGETVELVLRGQSGRFAPTPYLMSTLCHELAHIKHMNHGPGFQALWAQLRREVRELQAKGYYGDGYWSSGTRLADSARVGGTGIEDGDLPEYLCGGAHSRTRPSGLRRRRKQAGPSLHTGAQTMKKRKAGSRVTTQNAFKGGGRALNEDVEDEEEKKAGAGFRKKAGSKRAREERAMAVERRLLALQQASGPPPSTSVKSEEESDSDDDIPAETDLDRRRTMLDSMSEGEAGKLKAYAHDFADDFILPSAGPSGSSTATSAGISSNAPRQSTSGGTTASGRRNGKDKASSTDPSTAGKRDQKSISEYLDSARPSKKQKLTYGNLVEDEVNHRKKEALGMIGSGRKLGGTSTASTPSRGGKEQTGSRLVSELTSGEPSGPLLSPTAGSSWPCEVCTLVNESGHLACSACATPRGQITWSGISS